MSRDSPCRVVRDFMRIQPDAPLVALTSIETIMGYIEENQVEELYGVHYKTLQILEQMMEDLLFIVADQETEGN